MVTSMRPYPSISFEAIPGVPAIRNEVNSTGDSSSLITSFQKKIGHFHHSESASEQ